MAQRLIYMLEGLGRMESWLRHQGRADLTACDRCCWRRLRRLARDARSVAVLTEDLIAELNTHERAKAQ